MELWIRSQNKKQLANITGLIVVDNEIRGFTNQKDYYELGTYKTKERAIEVLDEIQKILNPQLIIKDSGKIIGSFEDTIVRERATYELKELSTFVYQMPEK